MLKVEVVSHQGKPVATPIAATFSSVGGNIGRDAGCLLSLADPHRHLSRQHAQIDWYDNNFIIKNITGNNFVIVNGLTLHPHESCVLEEGHQIYIGHYLLKISALAVEKSDRSMNEADTVENRIQSKKTAPLRLHTNTEVSQSIDNPFDVLGAKQASLPADDPLIYPGNLNLAQIEPEKLAGSYADPFSLPSLSSRNASDPLFDNTRQVSLRDILGQPKNIDDLYGDSTASLPGLDPLKETDSVQALGPLDTHKSVDPLVLFSNESNTVHSLLCDTPSVVMDDHSDQLVMHLDLPLPISENENHHKEFIKTSPDSLPQDKVGSAAADLSAIDKKNLLDQTTKYKTTQAESSSSTSIPAQTSDTLSVDEHKQLVQAFLQGAGLPKDMIPQRLTPEFMNIVGSMLLTAMQGTVDLITARAATKREVKAEMTLILPTHNNPLKFVPDGNAALIHMLGKQIPGFLGPIEAMQDAFNDLRTHQVGIFAGMRAALAEVLQRFNPADVEKSLEQLPMIDSIMRAHRKAKLWDLYDHQFKKIFAEAEEDFDVIFGSAFAAAYEKQIRSTREDLVHNK